MNRRQKVLSGFVAILFVLGILFMLFVVPKLAPEPEYYDLEPTATEPAVTQTQAPAPTETEATEPPEPTLPPVSDRMDPAELGHSGKGICVRSGKGLDALCRR